MDDLISRQASIDALNDGAEFLRRVLDDADIVGAERAKYEWGLGLIESYIYDMKELPSAQPEFTEQDMRDEFNAGYACGMEAAQSERKKGKWINDIRYPGWTCTHCNYHDGNKTDNYCPNCGAEMER